MKKVLRFLVVGRLFLSPALAAGESGHSDPVGPLLIALILILFVAKLGAEAFERLHLPAVMGEIIGGLILGNLVLLDPDWNFFEPLRILPLTVPWAITIDGLARLGVLILLFEVGLESTIQGMLKVGAASLRVAVLGVVAPFLLGFGVSWLCIRQVPAQLAAATPAGFNLLYLHLFIGAVLCATSVGITARVFKDLGKLQTPEAQIVLGAAVIDDILGLIILTIVSGIVIAAESGKSLDIPAILRLVGIALLFLAGSLALGVKLIPKIMPQLARLRTGGIMLISALLFAFSLSYLASATGLAAIVGAFAAGLILDEVHFHGFRQEIRIEQLLRPISTFLVPIFFVLMGIQVRLETFADLSVVGLAAGLTLAAIAGKQICGLGVFDKGLDRITIGVGMIPRGEVGLIFAAIGKELKVIDDAAFSAIVIMVLTTTLVTPPLLKLTLSRSG